MRHTYPSTACLSLDSGESDDWHGTAEVLFHQDHGANFDPESEINILKATELEEGTLESCTVSAVLMARAAMDALCFMYGYLGVSPRADSTKTFSALTEGSSECSLVQHVRHCDHQWGGTSEVCPDEGLACYQMKIILGHTFSCEAPACGLCNDLCTVKLTGYFSPRMPLQLCMLAGIHM